MSPQLVDRLEDGKSTGVSASPLEIETQGLSENEARKRLERTGRNEIPAPELPGIGRLFTRQFLSPFIYMLLIAAVTSFMLGQNPSGVFILLVLLLNACIGTVQEYSAQRAAAALRKMVKGETRVIRDGKTRRIDIEELVPGDLILLASGDKVPADTQLLSVSDLIIDESMLTGESQAVTKQAGGEIDRELPLTERANAGFAGTIVSHGRAKALVTETGLNTVLGKIATGVSGEFSAEPPLIIRIRKFTYSIALAILLAIVLLTLLMLLRGGYDGQEIALMTIGLAVSVIPEGLPAALTVALAIGMRRMARCNVIIRKLIAVEALGSCTFICSDKTGTLTVNELTIRKVVFPDGRYFDVSGEGVAPDGTVKGDGDRGLLEELCTAGVLANESQLDYSGGAWAGDGDIVDVAFLVLAKKAGFFIGKIRGHRQLKLIPYESGNAYSGSIHEVGDTKYLYVKGSPEKIITNCRYIQTPTGPREIDRALIEEQVKTLAARGYRLIALAMQNIEDSDTEVLSEMTYLGMAAMLDPLRPEAADAIRQCRDGNINVAMVTGDHPATAKSIAIELGLCDENSEVVTGSMLAAARKQGQEEEDSLIRESRVFARIEPQQKEQIVDSLIRQGHYVAVTGDGVNDAPAMRRAHAAIAMGKRGTDVARETAELIITDDNFASIVAGIEQGRVVYNNIRKVIGLLVATGFSAILLFFLCVFAGLPMPMIAVQLLWLNLVANGLQDVALAFEPKEGGELAVPPRAPSEPIFERHIIEHVLVAGCVMGIIAFLNFYLALADGASVESARNLTLMLMVLFGNIHALNSRSEKRSVFTMPLKDNLFLVLAVPLAQLIHIGAMYTPVISDVLQLQPVTLQQWTQLLLMASTLLVVEEIHKMVIRRRHHKSTNDSTKT